MPRALGISSIDVQNVKPTVQSSQLFSSQIIIHPLKHHLHHFNILPAHTYQRFVHGLVGEVEGDFLELPGSIGEAYKVDAPVCFGWNAPYQLLPLEIVDQARDAGLVAKRAVAEFLLAQTIFLPQMIQHAPLLNGDLETRLPEILLQTPRHGSRRHAVDHAVKLASFKLVVWHIVSYATNFKISSFL